MEAKYLKKNRKFCKNYYMAKYGSILKSLKCQTKLEFFKMGHKKILLGQIPGKNQNHKSKFSNEFCSVAKKS
jgi:hypothetical protein